MITRAEKLVSTRLEQENSVEEEIELFKSAMRTVTRNVVNFMRDKRNQPKSKLKDAMLDLKNELSILAADYSLDKKDFKAKGVKSVAFEIFEKLKEKPKPKFRINPI